MEWNISTRLKDKNTLAALFVIVFSISLAAEDARPEIVIAKAAHETALEDNKDDKADEPKPDKSIYNLFRPAPRELMRDMETDRPDETEAARTLDAGHFQIETELFSFSYDDRNSGRPKSREKQYNFGQTNVKVGLFDNADFQVVIDNYSVRFTNEKNGRTTTQRGFGDVTLRSKINILGNENDKAAFALLPFVKIPTNQDRLGNNAVEGGLIAPWTVALPWEWTTSGEAKIEVNRNDGGGGRHVVYGGTYEFSHAIVRKDLNGYVEFAGSAATEKGSTWEGRFNTGMTWAITGDIRLDLGVGIGLTRAAQDVKPFVGMSLRI